MQSDEDLMQWADDHGYQRGRCNAHGIFWSDTFGCPSCEEEERMRAESEAEDARLDTQDNDDDNAPTFAPITFAEAMDNYTRVARTEAQEQESTEE